MIYPYYQESAYKGVCSIELLEYEFEGELYKEYMVENNPKRHLAYKLARGIENARSFYAIECRFAELVELIEGDE